MCSSLFYVSLKYLLESLGSYMRRGKRTWPSWYTFYNLLSKFFRTIILSLYCPPDVLNSLCKFSYEYHRNQIIFIV